MSEDVREAILSRLLAVAAAAAGSIADVGRNDLFGDDGSSKRITLFDGDEMIPESDALFKRPPATLRTARMFPILVVNALAKPKDVGADLSAMRGKLIKAVEQDSQLIALTYNNQGGRYLGIEMNAFFAGILTVGQSPLKFGFVYALRPDLF